MGSVFQIGSQISKFAIVSLRTCYRSVCKHPFLLGLLLFLIFLHSSFPFLFHLLVSTSPVIVCTAVLLGTLLSFGQSNIPEIEQGDRLTTHDVASLRTWVQRGDTVVETDGSFSADKFSGTTRDVVDTSLEEASSTYRRVNTEVEDHDSSDVFVPLIEENLQHSKSEKRVMEEDVGKDVEFENQIDIFHKEKLGIEGMADDVEAVEKQYTLLQNVRDQILQVKDDTSPPESANAFRGEHLDSFLGGFGNDDHADNDESGDESSDSGSDGAESSSPDASMVDILPILDELHPLLVSKAPQPTHIFHDESDTASGRSDISNNGSVESDEDIGNRGGEVEDDGVEYEGCDKEEVQKQKEDERISAIKWTEDDQKNLIDLGNLELERNQHLEKLIASRRTRMVSNIAADQSDRSNDSCVESDDDIENQVGEVEEDGVDYNGGDEGEAQTEEEDERKSAINWTEDDQKNIIDLGNLELERNQHLEKLIASRRTRIVSDAAVDQSDRSNDSSVQSDEDIENQRGEVEEDGVGYNGGDEGEAQMQKEDESKAAIKWTEDDQKNLMDLGNLELERNQRLESLIARRRARKSFKLTTEKNLIDFDGFDLPFNVTPISTARGNPFDSTFDDSYDNMGLPPIPGSAPSIMLARRNPFDLPYDSNEEKPDLKGDHFEQEFLASHANDAFFRRHESFNLGSSNLGDAKKQKQDFKWRPVFVPERLASEGTGIHSFQRQLSEVSESKLSSVPDTESVSSATDLDDKKFSEQDFTKEREVISNIYPSSGLLNHYEDVYSLEMEQAIQRDVLHDGFEIELGERENMEPSEVSDSRLMFVPDTYSASSAADLDGRKFNGKDFTNEDEFISSIHHASGLVDLESHSYEVVNSLEMEHATKGNAILDELEIKLSKREPVEGSKVSEPKLISAPDTYSASVTADMDDKKFSEQDFSKEAEATSNNFHASTLVDHGSHSYEDLFSLEMEQADKRDAADDGQEVKLREKENPGLSDNKGGLETRVEHITNEVHLNPELLEEESNRSMSSLSTLPEVDAKTSFVRKDETSTEGTSLVPTLTEVNPELVEEESNRSMSSLSTLPEMDAGTSDVRKDETSTDGTSLVPSGVHIEEDMRNDETIKDGTSLEPSEDHIEEFQISPQRSLEELEFQLLSRMSDDNQEEQQFVNSNMPSLSTFSEVSEKVSEETEGGTSVEPQGDLNMEFLISPQHSLEESEIRVMSKAVDDDQFKEPVYDSSPLEAEKLISLNSISSDVQAEISETVDNSSFQMVGEEERKREHELDM